MARFLYKAKDVNGNIISSSIRALSISSAAEKLEQQGLIILEITEEISSQSYYSSSSYSSSNILKDTVFTVKEKLEFFNSFYYMFSSGLSIHQIFVSVMQSSSNKKIKALCKLIVSKIEKGCSLDEAFQGYENVLGIAYSKLIVAGETSGKLDNVLKKIVTNIKREEEIKRNIISSISYPLLLFALAIAVFLFFKFFVLKIFESFGSGIRQCAVISLLIATVIKIFIVFAIIAGSVFYVYWNKNIFKKVINIVSKFPLVKQLIKNYCFSNFFAVLALAYDAGVSLPKSIELANSVVSISSIKSKISTTIKRISNGCEVTTAFIVINVFSPFALSQISAGEKAGELEKMFAIISHDYEKQMDLTIKVLSKVIEPIMIGFAALMVVYVAVTAYKSYYANLTGALGF